MATKKAAASEAEVQNPDRTHADNLVEVESLHRTFIVDGRRYGPFGPDEPKERRMVPKALVETFLLKPVGESDTIDTGTGGERLSGIETPVPVEGQVPLTEDEKLAAAEAAGHSQEAQLAKRDVRTGAEPDEPESAARKTAVKKK